MNPTGTEAVLAERGNRYGSFVTHAEATQTLKAIFKAKMGQKWDYLADDQKESLEMIAHKLGRILNGDPNYGDSWRDIAGYAQLVADRLEGVGRYAPKCAETTLPIPPNSTELEDPHAELRATWREGQRWQGTPSPKIYGEGLNWNTYDRGDVPGWYADWIYRRHPEDKDAEPSGEQA